MRRRSVPRLVSSSRTIFLSKYQPVNSEMKNPPNGIISLAVMKSKKSNSVMPNRV